MDKEKTASINEIKEAIALFMGGLSIKQIGNKRYVYYQKSCAQNIDDLKYNTSWDALMPVVEKIESIYDHFHGYFAVYISSNSCCIQGTKLRTTPGNEHYAYFNEVVHETKLLSTFYAVYSFIEWYKNKK